MGREVGLAKVLGHRYRERVLGYFWPERGGCRPHWGWFLILAVSVTIEIIGVFFIKMAAFDGGHKTEKICEF